MSLIYKLCPAALWREAEAAKIFRGAPVDLADGYIHFSTANQVEETAARHFAGQAGLLLIAVRPEPLGSALRWEASRGGALFPHLYGVLPMSAVRSAVPLTLGVDGRHVFPDGLLSAASFDPVEHGWERLSGENFIGLVGPLWARPADEATEPGHRRYGFLAETRHLNLNGMVHGGMILTFVDHAIGMTARSVNKGNRQATVQLDTHFVSGVEGGEFVEARCRLVRETKSVLFMAADLAVGERPVATALGVWKLGPPYPPPVTGLSDARS